MTPEEVGARLTGRLASAGLDAAEVGVSGGGAHARAVADVPSAQWVAAARTARDGLGLDFFDWLSAVDELDEGFTVVAHLWSIRERFGLLLRTRLPREDASLASIVEVYPGASWHERETNEMFGIGFPGDLPRLLLTPEFEGHPLRKDFVLASRVAKPWPGAKEPGEGHGDAPRRQAVRPPGVPAPGEWGPAAGRGDA
ncbi:NADH-quinone oxidoreductase subunit C [Hamadaea sp. NPDC051192]|uniref:NADH-quinone oxidoreductase subunit C n=1 Tax=Hamadaea sp. NPDC051192 TaxID=3154940 RepID=UPI00342B899A